VSARPPFDPPGHEPLDAEEAAIARALLRQPDAGPAPALDARILAQARAAVAVPARRRRPWFMGTGFGAAAAAVMAAGVAWQLGWIDGVPGTATTAPAESRRSDADGAAQEALERVDIEFIREERKREEAAPPPPPRAPAAPPAPVRQAPAAQKVTPPAAPPPPQAAELMRDAAPVILAEPAPAAAPQAFPADAPAANAAAAGPASERSGEAESARASAEDDRESLDTITVTGTRLGKQRTALPAWTEDALLEPEAWLERIRERVREGDRQGAEHSLRRFVLKHPTRAVPAELQRLLVE
jgi:hypothetical protein